MLFESIKTPKELMKYLDENIEYGVIDNNGNKITDSNSIEFQNACNNDWRLKPVEQILIDRVGHCYDQVEIEREWFEKNGYEIKTFWISAYQEGVENSGFCHTYLVYKKNNTWNLFEHSDYLHRGIYYFNTLLEAVKWQAENQIKTAERNIKAQKQYTSCIKEYNKPPIFISMQEYLNFIDNSEDYPL